MLKFGFKHEFNCHRFKDYSLGYLEFRALCSYVLVQFKFELMIS